MVAALQRFASGVRVFDFNGHTEFSSNTTNAYFPPFNLCHLLDKMLLISATEASFWAAVLQLTL